MKFLVLLLAAWFVLAMPSAAHAAPVAALVTAIASAIGGLGAFGQAIFGLALKIGASLLAKAMTKEPDPVGVRGQIEVGGDNPISFIVGTYATTGQLEYVGTFGKAGKTPNAYLTQVISLGDLPVKGLADLFVNGEKCTIDYDETKYGDWGFPVTDFEDDGDNALWIKFYDGTQTTADPLLIAEFGDHPERPWTSDMLGRGVPYAIVTAQFKRDVLTGPPRCTFVVEGIKLYDPRKDTTAGGSGAHRWGDRSTYEWSDNPKVIQYNVMRGIYYGGEWVYGGQGMRAFQLPVSSWFAAMNECDRLVPIKAGGTEKNFRCGFEVKGDLEPIELCQKLDRACNGKTAENGGIYKTVSGNPGMPVYYFTDENLIVSEPQSFNPFPGLEKVYNGAHASYPEPDEAWAAKDAPPRYRADLEEEDDGRRLIANLTYEGVPYKRQVQRLMRAALEANRRFRSHQGVFAPAAKLLEPLDVISWTSARNGYDNKRFQLGAIDDLNNVNQSAAFSELDPADYDWSTDYELPDSVGPIGRVKPEPRVLTGFGVFPDTVKDANGNDRRPAILLVWPWNAEDVAIRAIAFQVRRADDEKKVFVGRFDQPEDGQVLLAPFSLVGNDDYEVRAKFITNSNTELFAWGTWLPVTTPDVQFIAEDILDGAVVASKIADAAITAAKLMDGAVEELKIADRAISTIKVKLSAIKTELVDNAAIVQSKIANAAIGDAQLAALAVTAAKLADNAVTTVKINSSAVVSDKLGAGAVTDAKLANLAVTTGKIANNAVTTTTIADNAITTPKLVANAVAADKIASNSILARHLVIKDMTAVNTDPLFEDASAWDTVNHGVKAIADGADGPNVLYSKTNLSSGFAWANKYPINQAKTYLFEFRARQLTAGDGRGFAHVRFYDAAGTPLYTDGAGWPAKNGAQFNHYFPASTNIIPTAWTRYVLTVGPEGTAKIPAGAVSFSIGFFTNYTATVFAEHQINMFRITEMGRGELIVDGAITANKVAALSISTDKLEANAITADKLATNSVTADKIVANAVVADKIAANAITAGKILVSDTTDVVMNGQFAGGSGDGWSGSGFAGVVPGSNRSGKSPYIGTLAVDASNQSANFTLNVPTKEGDEYYVSMDVAGGGSPPTLNAQLQVAWNDESGSQLSTSNIVAPSTGAGWITAAGIVVAPAGAAAIRRLTVIRLGTSTGQFAFFTNVSMRKRNTAELIVDGAIIADKLATNSVTTSKIVAGAVTATEIGAEAVTTVKLAAEAVVASKIAANTITSDKMVANSITARELVLVDFENVIPNGFFGTAVGTLDGWDTISTNISVVQGTSRSPAPSPFIARYEATATLDLMATSRTIQCSPGDKFHAQFDYAGSGGSIAGTFQLLMNFRDAAGGSIGNGTVSATISSTGWATASGEITAPAGTVTIGFVQMRRAAGSTGDGAAFVANLLIRRKKNSELIVDGAIIADKLATNSVTTNKIAALAITAAKIATRVITADKLILGGVTYEEIGNNEVTVTATAYTNSITTISVTNSWAGIGSVTLAHGNTGGKVLLKGICTHSADIPKLQGDFPLVDMRFVDSNTGNIIETFTNIYPYGTCQIYSAWSPPSGRTSTTFNCQIRIASARTTTLDFDFRNRFVEATALRR